MERELSKIDAAIIITLLTVFGYGLAFSYLSFYQGYYHLPEMLLDININTIIKPLAMILMILFVLCWIVYGFYIRWPRLADLSYLKGYIFIIGAVMILSVTGAGKLGDFLHQLKQIIWL